MSKCIVTPTNNKGEKSPLYLQIKKIVKDRNEAIKWYTKATSPEFVKVFPNVRLINGEPTLEDLINKCGFSELLDESVILSSLNSEYKESKDSNYNGVFYLQDKATQFNTNNPFKSKYYADVESVGDKVELTVKSRRKDKNNTPNKITFNNTLNKQLENLLNSWGVDIGYLSDIEERLGINGITDLSLAKDTAEGFKTLIRISKGVEGEKALPEEFAHVAVAMMGEHPLKVRVLNTLRDEEVLAKILGDDYEDYYRKYNGNIDLLAEESLGKLVANALNNKEYLAPNKSLFQRFLDLLKNFFNKFNTSDIDNRIEYARSIANDITGNIINNKYNLNINNINHTNSLYNLNSRISRDKALLQKIIEQELKRLKIYGTKEEFSIEQESFIADLSSKLENNQSLLGVYEYLQNSIDVLTQLEKRLYKVIDSDLSESEQFKVLRNIRNYMSSYGSIILSIRKEMSEANIEGDNRYREKLKVSLDSASTILADLSEDFYTISKDKFTNFIKHFVGEGLAITIGKDKYRKTYTAEELVSSMDRDITIFDRWLDSMADSSDPILQIYDQVVKKQKGLARLDTINIEKEVLRRTRELELSGIKDTSWMYERDDKGNITGNFIQPIDWKKYKDNKAKFIKYLNEKYGENPSGIDLHQRNQELRDWYKANTIKDDKGMKTPRLEIYSNPAYERLNSKQKEYHKYIIDLKAHLDNFLPDKYTSINKAPQIRKDFIDRIVSTPNKTKAFWETMKDSIVRREDDIDMENRDKGVVIDFEGNPVNKLPIYYTRSLDNMSDLSLDTASTMIAYAAMANDFNRMNEVIDTLEVGKLILEQRKIRQSEGGKHLLERFKVLGIEVTNNLTKQGDKSLFIQRLEDFMNMQVYGKMQLDEGTIGKADVSKMYNMLNKMTSYSTTALSLLTGVSSALQNISVANIEAASGKFFNVKELAAADKEYYSLLPSFLGELGSRIKTNKLSLFEELFNVTQDYRNHVRDVRFNKKNIAAKLFNENSLFFTTQAGDHWAQLRTAIAIAKRKQVLIDGKLMPFWDALEVVPIDSKNPKLGSKLIINPKATNPDSSKISNDDIIKFSNLSRGINNTLYGIYNQEDKSAIQKYGAGRLVMLYRNWMRPMYLNRFGRGKYNFDLESCTEGYYWTMFRFLQNNYRDLKQSEFDIVKSWNNLSAEEKSNMRKGMVELATYFSLFLLVGMIEDLPDDEEKPWALRMASYSALRLKSDMGALIPGPNMLDESLRLIDSPFAAVTTLKKIRNLLNLLYPDSYTTQIQSGMYEGYTLAERALIDLLPFRRQIVKAFDPDEAARWFKASK